MDRDDLVQRIVAGDSTAESELIEQYGEGVHSVLRRWTRDPATAEDLRDPRQIPAFLRGLARNLSIQLYRRAEQRTPHHTEEKVLRRLRDPGINPLADLLDREKKAMVRRVLSELGSERDRQLLFRFYIAEHSAERICADLQLSGEHFYRVLHRARARCRHILNQRLLRSP